MFPRNLLLFCLLFLPLLSRAQEAPVPQPWLERVERAKRLLQEVKARRDSLAAVPQALQDSVGLKVSLDSLGTLKLDSIGLAQQQDSLLQAFSQHQLALKTQQEAEEKLQQEIKELQAAATQGLLSPEALGLLKEIEQAGPFGSLNPKGMATAAAGKALPGQLFTGSQAKLRAAMAGMDKYKGRYEKVESLKDMPKGYFKLNALKGKPWPERLVLGTLWQFGRQERFYLDLAPTLAWRFTDLLSLGAGVQGRLGVDLEARPWVSREKVLGYLFLADHQIKQGFFGRLSYEHLNAPVTKVTANGEPEQTGKEWVPGLALGLGKTFGLYGPVQGYALAQYNVLHQGGKTPYLSPFQVKLGLFIEAKDLVRKKK